MDSAEEKNNFESAEPGAGAKEQQEPRDFKTILQMTLEQSKSGEGETVLEDAGQAFQS